MDWETVAKDFANSLGRYYRNPGEIDLALLLEICGSDLFSRHTYTYPPKIIELVKSRGGDQAQAERHISHGISLGLFEIAVPGVKINRTHKFSPFCHVAVTARGRIARAAARTGREEFGKFILTAALLETDFDIYGLMLKMAEENNGQLPDAPTIAAQFNKIILTRKQMLADHLPTQLTGTIAPIVKKVKWRNLLTGPPFGREAPRKASVRLEEKTIIAYLNQRIRCAQGHLGHLNAQRQLTPAGHAVAAQLPLANEHFMLGPSATTAQNKIISFVPLNPKFYGPIWNFLRPAARLAAAAQPALKQEMADFMREVLPEIKMGMFNWASLETVTPYLYWREVACGGRVNEKEFFQELLKENKKLKCLQQPRLSQSYYHCLE